MILCRHGLMLVGDTMSGKTTCYEVLADALTDLAMSGTANEQKVQTFVVNPKSITINQLFGFADAITKEWTEGIFAYIFKRCSSSRSPDRKWIVFNGPVDAGWIENMNTVLDDNKKLCLSSGDTISMGENMTMMFEVSHLTHASPATISRCGMIFMEPENLGWWPLFQTWMNSIEKIAVLGL